MNAVLEESLSGFRPVTEYDLETIVIIERAAYDFPWSPGLLRDCLDNNYFFCAMIENDVIVGYGIMSCAMDEAHILNICIDPECQRRGKGKKLLLHLLEIARKHKAEMAFLEVRLSNEAAQSLYETNGFNQLDVRKNYYPNGETREDAVLYAKAL